MEVRGRWWNGAWGRMARRDIWLMSDDDRWRVRGRVGGDEGREVNYQFDEEASARAMVERMMKTSVGRWRDLTDALRRQSERRQAE